MPSAMLQWNAERERERRRWGKLSVNCVFVEASVQWRWKISSKKKKKGERKEGNRVMTDARLKKKI